MTIKQFYNTKWGVGMQCIYDNQEYMITAVDFTEFLLEIKDSLEQKTWVRCENVSLSQPLLPQ